MLGVLVVLLVIGVLGGCSVGKGYILEPGLSKCVSTSVESGNIEVSTLMGPSITVTGSGLQWHSVGKECEGMHVDHPQTKGDS